MANEEAKKLIAALVQREVRRILPEICRQLISNSIMEAVVNVPKSGPFPISNGHKLQAMRESARPGELEEYPTLGERPYDRSRLQEMMGYGEGPPRMERVSLEDGEVSLQHSRSPISVNVALDANGNHVPIQQSQIDPAVYAAMNRDYSKMVKSWSK